MIRGDLKETRGGLVNATTASSLCLGPSLAPSAAPHLVSAHVNGFKLGISAPAEQAMSSGFLCQAVFSVYSHIRGGGKDDRRRSSDPP